MKPSEAQTRKERIDAALADAGWKVNNPYQVVQEFVVSVVEDVAGTYQNEKVNKTQFADYVLLGKDGKPLAVVEAKRGSKDARVGEEQAKQYALNIQKSYQSDLPF